MDAATAKTLPIRQLLASFGHSPAKDKGRDLWYLSPFRDEHTASFHVNVPGNMWYDQGEGKGGNALDLAVRLLGHDKGNISPTLSWLTREYTGEAITPIERQVSPKQPEIIIKAVEPIGHTLRLYLTRERGIDWRIGQEYLDQVRFTNHGKEYYALGFKNDSGGYELRNALWKGSSSPKTITSIAGENTGKVYCFEGFMDMLSFLTIAGTAQPDGDLLVLNGTAMKERAVEYIRSRGYDRVMTYFDNGKGGAAATGYFKQELPGKVQPQNHIYQKYDDLNDHLTKKGRER